MPLTEEDEDLVVGSVLLNEGLIELEERVAKSTCDEGALNGLSSSYR